MTTKARIQSAIIINHGKNRMPPPDPQRSSAIRALIADFLQQRLTAKVEKLADDDPRRTELGEYFNPTIWLDDAARRVGWIQLVTHSLKPLHPDAQGSSLFRKPSSMPALAEVGSHSLGSSFDADVVGSASALDVYKFLSLSYQGCSLLDLAITKDADFGSALSDDEIVAHTWMAAFAGLAEIRGPFSSHTFAKQIYWPIGDDPHDDASYHLLAPLYPTSLVHRVYQALQEDRFGDAARAAREARRAGEMHECPVHEYPNLAVQRLGGTKPQNISQLNSERHGDNYLLASVPPVWKSPDVKPPYGVDSLFRRYGARREVQSLLEQLRRFLQSAPARSITTRNRRDELVNALIDELMQFAAELRTLGPGWSAAAECDLPTAHCAWLDPFGSLVNVDDAADRVASDFANWVNGQIRDPLPMGDAEYLYWRKLARKQLSQEEWEEAHEQ